MKKILNIFIWFAVITTTVFSVYACYQFLTTENIFDLTKYWIMTIILIFGNNGLLLLMEENK